MGETLSLIPHGYLLGCYLDWLVHLSSLFYLVDVGGWFCFTLQQVVLFYIRIYCSHVCMNNKCYQTINMVILVGGVCYWWNCVSMYYFFHLFFPLVIDVRRGGSINKVIILALTINLGGLCWNQCQGGSCCQCIISIDVNKCMSLRPSMSSISVWLFIYSFSCFLVPTPEAKMQMKLHNELKKPILWGDIDE